MASLRIENISGQVGLGGEHDASCLITRCPKKKKEKSDASQPARDFVSSAYQSSNEQKLILT